LVTVVILTYNEEIHIRRAIENVRGWAVDVFVVDSHSTDRTAELAEEAGARVFLHAFENYAAQREWALRELPYRTEWMLFLDADELVSAELKEEVRAVLPHAPDEVGGYYIKRRFFWMGRWLRHGGIYPVRLLRLVRPARARCGERSVNEHLEVDGEAARLRHDLLHVDLKPIGDWIAKHNRYATLEAKEQVRADQRRGNGPRGRLLGSQPERKLWLREYVWEPLLPPLLRPFVYFVYAYLFRLGFLDGRAGFMYHVLQGFSYRFLIEVKYLAYRNMGGEEINAPDADSRRMQVAPQPRVSVP
jgi:glycosyltransferase involved in cell wall biosynthesis